MARTRFDAESGVITETLRTAVARHPRARLVELAGEFCDAQWCYPTRNGRLLFRDVDHLSRQGAVVGLERRRQDLDWLIAP